MKENVSLSSLMLWSSARVNQLALRKMISKMCYNISKSTSLRNHMKGFWVIFWKTGVQLINGCLALQLPRSHPSMKDRNTHHLESTTVGRVSELRVPWGRRFLGPGKRHTHPMAPFERPEGLPSLCNLPHHLCLRAERASFPTQSTSVRPNHSYR